jgi:hypothetical protein
VKKKIQGSFKKVSLLAMFFVVVVFLSYLSADNFTENRNYFAQAPQLSEILPDQLEVTWTTYPDFNSRTHYQVQLNHALYGSSQQDLNTLVKNLEPGGTYAVSVVTYHEGTVAGVSSPATVLMPPAVPSEIMVYDVGSASFKLIWQQVNSATKYRVYRFPDILLAEVDEPQNKVTLTGLTPGEAFTIFVSAVNSTGESYRSESMLVQLLPPPPAITIIEDEIGPTWFSMKWEPIENAESYTIVINDTDVATLASTTLEYRAEGLPAGTAVGVKIRSQNSSGASETSEQVIVQLLPATPVLAATEVSSYSCTLQWSVANGATYYKVYLNKEWAIFNVPSSINQVVITENVTAGMTATYTVKAGNGTGESEHSVPVLVTFTGSETMRLAGAEQMLNGLLFNPSDRLGISHRGQPLVSIYFPEELGGAELDLEASYLDSLASMPQLRNIKFIAVFTTHRIKLSSMMSRNLIWKKVRDGSIKYSLPGMLPLVKFYDSEGWLQKQARVSMPILTAEEVLKHLPEAIEKSEGLVELYSEERETFNRLHKQN